MIGAVLAAIAVNGSPVEVAERDLEAVRPIFTVPPRPTLWGCVAGKIQRLISYYIAFPRQRIFLRQRQLGWTLPIR